MNALSGTIKRLPLSRLSLMSPPIPVVSDDRSCTFLSTGTLPHKSKGVSVVAQTRRSDTGVRLLLCEHCKSYVEAYQWANANGLTVQGESALAALSAVWRSECGYMLPSVRDWRGPVSALDSLWHSLKTLQKLGLIKRIAERYLIRDACPSCYRRGGCAAECGLHFAPELFAERLEVACG